MIELPEATIQTIDTPDGPFTLVVDEQGCVLASGWTANHQAVLDRIHRDLRPKILAEGTTAAAAAVTAYYGGDLAAILAVPVLQHGTAFQEQGWDWLREIAAGEPLTYAEFASRLGKPAAVRAAAGICARNAPALFVPCHRVLRSDGTLGGFAWDTDVKQSLLDRESHARNMAG